MQQILESTLSYWWRTEPTRCLAGQSAEVRAGSESRANAHWGSPGTWEALSFPCLTSNQPAGAGRSIPWPTDARVHRPLGAKQWTEVRYRVARETEASGTSDSGQSIPIVPVKQGNPPQGSLRREGGCREAFTRREPGGSMNRGEERCLAHRGQGASQRDFYGSRHWRGRHLRFSLDQAGT